MSLGVTAKFSSASYKFGTDMVLFVCRFYKHTVRMLRAKVMQIFAEVL